MNLTMRLFYCFTISALLLTFSANAWSGDWITAITIPSEDVSLSFIHPGRIDKVYVREGELVKVNQTLIKQNDAAEQAKLLLIKKQSEDTIRIETHKASLSQKRIYLEKLEWAAERGSATELEIDYVKLEVRKAELSLKEVEFEHEQNKRKYKEARLRVNNMRLKSPIDGRVDKIEVDVGEAVNGLADTVRVVRTDPLYIDVHVPLEDTGSIELGQIVKIIFPGNEAEVLKGTIIFISTVADAASSTLRTRIEVPNISNRPAGEHVSVLFLTSEDEVEKNK